MKTIEIDHRQMEISFTRKSFRITAAKSRRAQRRRRLNRAHWWFQRMRDTVNQALEWDSAPAARPEQIYLTLSQGNRI